jgi:RHS repeat-associated protein
MVCAFLQEPEISAGEIYSPAKTTTTVFGYDYTAFGEKYAPLTNVNVEQRYTYTGREKNPVSESMYYRYRTYEASLGRFRGRDPIYYTDDINIYGYVVNLPTILLDYYGLTKCEIEIHVGHNNEVPQATSSDPAGNLTKTCSAYAIYSCGYMGKPTSNPAKPKNWIRGAPAQTADGETLTSQQAITNAEKAFALAVKHAPRICEEENCDCKEIKISVICYPKSYPPKDSWRLLWSTRPAICDKVQTVSCE